MSGTAGTQGKNAEQKKETERGDHPKDAFPILNTDYSCRLAKARWSGEKTNPVLGFR